MKWEIVIGLETHTQLSTKSKIFSGSSTAFGASPNTQANAVDMALPGTLPVMNREAVAKAISFGLAIGAKVAPLSVFERKHYFYPDLPKNYQTSQLEIPVVQGGKLNYFVGEEEKTLNLTRAHLEEDAGKSLHEDFEGFLGEPSTGIDLNRTGTPLLEIVTEPELRSAAEAVAYARALHGLVVWLGICDGNMQEGSFRVDANVSVRPFGQKEFGTRTEIKNVNSFRFLERAILFEARRQIELIEDGGKVIQETRLYDETKDETRSMRTKEDAHDYRYFPCPDLPPLVISQEWIDRVKSEMPELPAARRERYESEFGLPAYHAAQLAKLIARIADNTISHKIARDVFQSMWSGENNADADAIIDAKGLKQISDSGAISSMIDEVIAANPAIVAQFREGKEKAFNSLVGQVMKAAKGKANPAQVNEILKQKLSA